MTTIRFALVLALALFVWLLPSSVGRTAFVPFDILWQYPPHTPPAGQGPPHNHLIGDMLYENYMWKVLLRRAVAEGQWPLWNPHSFCGHPIYATGQASTFYPLNAIFAILPLPHAFVVFTGLHLWLAGVLTFVFLRRIGVSGFGAAVGGLSFAFCGFFAMRLIWPMLLGSAIWLPLMLLCLLGLAGSSDPRRSALIIAAGAAVFALPLLAGFFEIAFYAYFAAGLYTLALSWRVLRERRLAGLVWFWAQTLAIVAVAVMLAGPQLLPFLEVKDRNIRAAQADYEKTVARALRAEHVLELLVPDIFGNPARHERFDLRERRLVPIEGRTNHYFFGDKDYSENGHYIGLLPFFLAMLSPGVRGRHRAFLAVLLVLSVLLAFGAPIYKVFYYTVPGFKQVRTPFRWFFTATFAVACLAGIGAEYWQGRWRVPSTRTGRAIAVLLIVAPLFLVISLLALLAWPEPAQRLAAAAMGAVARLNQFADPWRLAGYMWAQFTRSALWLWLAASIVALPFLRRWSARVAASASGACLIVLVSDAGLANRPFMTHADPKWIDRVPPAVEYLRGDPEIFRIGRYGQEYVLYPNLPVLYGMHDTGGYDSVILSDYARYLEAIEPQRRLFYNLVTSFDRKASLDSPLFSLLNVRYLLSRERLDHPDWEGVFDDGTTRIYRNRRERPRAFVVHDVRTARSLDDALEQIRSPSLDLSTTAIVYEEEKKNLPELESRPPASGRPAASATITGYRAARVDLDVTSGAPGLLVLCDMMYPGWRAFVNDRPAAILKVNGIFRGVAVPEGRSRVSFRFEPQAFRTGSWMAAAGLLLVLGLPAGACLRPRKRITAALGATEQTPGHGCE